MANYRGADDARPAKEPSGRPVKHGHTTTCVAAKNLRPSEIFDVLWGALVEILGAPATATLLRRSAKRRLGDFPELGELAITRKKFEYGYAVPADWKHANERSNAALQALVQDLCSLLLELTGPVVLHRLKALSQVAKFVPSLSEDK